MNKPDLLYPAWNCSICGKTHYEMTDHTVCRDFYECSKRAARKGKNVSMLKAPKRKQ